LLISNQGFSLITIDIKNYPPFRDRPIIIDGAPHSPFADILNHTLLTASHLLSGFFVLLLPLTHPTLTPSNQKGNFHG